MKYNSTVLVLFTAIVCVVVALPAFAQTGEVYSLNVVGFQKLTATSGLTMVSTPFIASSNTLDGVIGNQMYGHKSSTYADQIYFWDVAGQRYLTFWLKNDGKWYDLNNQPATSIVTTLKGFWMQNRVGTTETVVVSGDVVDSTAITNPLVSGLNLVSYPFSTEININSSGLTNGYSHKSSTYADGATIWDAANQRYVTFWLKNDRKWYDLNNNLATNVLVGAGKSIWYENRGGSTFNWVEVKPYTL